MDVIGYDPYFSIKNALALDSKVKFTANLDDIYAVSDYITVHVPATPETTNMINTESLAKCKDGVRILNFARNELVDVDAVKAGLESGKVSYYATDFPNENTVGVEGIITLPHLGASTPEAEDNCASMAAEEMMEYLEKGNIVNSVNYPAVSAPMVVGCERICVLSKADAMDAVKNAITGAEQFNAKTRGNYGYTIADVKSADVAKVEAVDGVLGVRVIK